jgi:hypothetical protein
MFFFDLVAIYAAIIVRLVVQMGHASTLLRLRSVQAAQYDCPWVSP